MADADSPSPTPTNAASAVRHAETASGPGEIGVHLSRINNRLRDLAADKALSREKYELYRTFYIYERAKLELQLSMFDVQERIEAGEQAVVASRDEFTRSTDIDKYEANADAAQATLNDARAELQAFSSKLVALSVDSDKREKGKTETRGWEKSRQWEAITPEELRPAVAAIRHQFEHDGCWKAEQCTMKLCDAALNSPSSTQAVSGDRENLEPYRRYLLALIGPKAQQSFLDPNHPAPVIFRSYFDLFEIALKIAVRLKFQDLFQIARVRTDTLSMHPVEWTRRHLQILISEEQTGIGLWINRVCAPTTEISSARSEDDDIFNGSWRAPQFVHMQPAGNTPYNGSTARLPEGLLRSHELLEAKSVRLIAFLMIELDLIAQKAHVEFAKDGNAKMPQPMRRDNSAKVPFRAKAGRPELRPANEWRVLRDAFRSLSDQELRSAPNNSRDRWLRAYADYQDKTFAHGQWHLSEGVQAGFRERFEVEATKAGIAISPDAPVEPIDLWLHNVFEDQKEHRSTLLAIADADGGIINRVCEASAMCCARLEMQSLLDASQRAGKLTDQALPTEQTTDSRIAADQTKSNSDAKREAVIRKVQNPNMYTTLTVPEAALYLDVKSRTVYRWTLEGQLTKGPRRGTIAISSIRKWEKKRAKKPPVNLS